MLRPVVFLTALVALTACAGAPASGLAGSEWRPVEIAGQPPGAPDAMFVAFGSDGALHGSGGCNNFSGGYESAGERLTISPLAATRMACPEPAMQDEGAFFAALTGTAAFLREGTRLTLLDGEGDVLARLAQTDWD